MTDIPASTSTSVSAAAPSRSYGQMIVQRFMSHRMAVADAVLVVLLCSSALFAQFVAPHDPTAIDTTKRFQGQITQKALQGIKPNQYVVDAAWNVHEWSWG